VAPSHEPEPEPVEVQEPEIEALLERALGPASVRLELLAPVLFRLDSDALEPVGVAMLHEVLHTLRTRPEIRKLEIQGYADARGDAAYNWDLSRRRALAVRDWLLAHGIEPSRLALTAHGKSSPLERDHTEQAHEQNRRVVFRVLELGEP
jgi:OOP family OmpA-OmpF porin